MLLEFLDLLACPICKEANRHWTIKGEMTDTRITNGTVICPNDHEWNITEEILRLHDQNVTEPMVFLDHPRTGLPGKKDVDEQERFEFLDAFQEIVGSMEFSSEDMIKVAGDPVLFLKYLPNTEAKILISHPEEGVLRQLQELAARKRMYNQMSFVRANDVGYIGKLIAIDVFNPNPSGNVTINLEKNASEAVKWAGKHSNLIYSGL